jgi:hypothetical protein
VSTGNEQVAETVTFCTSSDFAPERFRECQPPEICEAIQYDGEEFPLPFLETGENVRLIQDGSRTLIGSETNPHTGDEYDMWYLRPGEWLVRHPGLGLRVHHPGNFEEDYEPA